MVAAAARHVRRIRLRELAGLRQSFGLAECSATFLLASVFWAPAVSETSAWWSVAVITVLALATYTLFQTKAFPHVPAVLVAYAIVYALSMFRASSFTVAADLRFYTRIMAAIAIAVLVRTASQRRHVLLLILVFVGSQIPIAIYQATKILFDNGRSATSGDAVTGLIGTSQSGILTLVAMIAAAIIAGAWLAGAASAKPALFTVSIFLAIGVISSSRIVVPFVLVEGAVIAAAGMTFGLPRPTTRRLLAVLGAALLAVPLTYGGIRAIYPRAFSGLFAAQNSAILGAGVPTIARQSLPVACRAASRTSDLLRNGDFECGVLGWVVGSGGAVISGDRHHALFGHQSLEVVANAPASDGSARSDAVPVRPGTLYVARAWVRAPTVTRIGMRLSDGASQITRVIRAGRRWRQVHVAVRVKTSRAFVEVIDIGRHSSKMWIDGVRLRRAGQHSASTAPPRLRGVQLLPGRLRQLRLAVRLSLHSGIGIALLGRGLGTSQLEPSYNSPEDIPRPQRTGSTYGGVLLTETGWLGLLAFFALLVWLALTGRTLWRSASRADRALGIALPGIAALTAAAASYATILQGHIAYAVVFWVLVGIAISAREDIRRAGDRTL